MTKVEEILSKISDDLYKLSPDEQNEVVLTLIKGIQAKRRADMRDLEEQKEAVENIFNKLKEEVCSASNVQKS